MKDNTQRVNGIMQGVKMWRCDIFCFNDYRGFFLANFALAVKKKSFCPFSLHQNLAMLVGALLSITMVPILMVWLIKGRILEESKNPINAFS